MNKVRSILPEAAQVGGLCMAVGGLWILAGFGWALLTAGVLTAAFGAAREAGLI